MHRAWPSWELVGFLFSIRHSSGTELLRLPLLIDPVLHLTDEVLGCLPDELDEHMLRKRTIMLIHALGELEEFTSECAELLVHRFTDCLSKDFLWQFYKWCCVQISFATS